jgi:hypothetical protein
LLTLPLRSGEGWVEGDVIEYCVSHGAIARVGPLTCILSPSGGEGRVRGMAASHFHYKCQAQ